MTSVVISFLRQLSIKSIHIHPMFSFESKFIQWECDINEPWNPYCTLLRATSSVIFRAGVCYFRSQNRVTLRETRLI